MSEKVFAFCVYLEIYVLFSNMFCIISEFSTLKTARRSRLCNFTVCFSSHTDMNSHSIQDVESSFTNIIITARVSTDLELSKEIIRPWGLSLSLSLFLGYSTLEAGFSYSWKHLSSKSNVDRVNLTLGPCEQPDKHSTELSAVFNLSLKIRVESVWCELRLEMSFSLNVRKRT